MAKQREMKNADLQEQLSDLEVVGNKRCLLVELPNEILDAIFEELDQTSGGGLRHDINSFSITHPVRDKTTNLAFMALCLSCKRLYEATRPFLFRNVTSDNSFHSVIKALVNGPLSLRFGTKHLTIQCFQLQPPSPERLDLLEQALATFPCRLQRGGRLEKGSIPSKKLLQGGVNAEQFEIEVLLALMPNLETLQIDITGLSYFKRGKALMCDWIRYQGINLGFGNLQTFVLSSSTPKASYRHRSFILRGILQSMPNLRHLVLCDISISPRDTISAVDIHEAKLLKPALSNLKSFTLRCGAIFDTAGEFEYLCNWFEMCTSLEAFSISWSGPDTPRPTLPPTRLLEALVATKSTLKMLSMETFDMNERMVEYWFRLETTMLSRFTKLETLRISSLCLINDVSGTTPMLAAMLPPSITKIAIVCYCGHDDECEDILLHIGVLGKVMKDEGKFANLKDCLVKFDYISKSTVLSFKESFFEALAGTGVNREVKCTR